jgi:hypothetical protein
MWIIVMTVMMIIIIIIVVPSLHPCLFPLSLTVSCHINACIATAILYQETAPSPDPLCS